MRTLKKTLSLLLAVALVLSLTVVGASAAYTGNKVDTLKDAADVGADYSEAVGVMVGLGIIEGYDDGTLRPETTYTREQAAKIIAYMQLGPKDADSLRCTKAPFTDVAADRWSAGYIAYCVEQGIIDGMGDGTFQPEAQLTGYQWAKMLLCAVGYGRNDEYVGSSWSLNTAKDALDKGIFDGDLVGADHTPLQRQQAILYAFNALTSVKVVVYSPSLGDYITKYGDFADRATITGTLGENVYKLDVDDGIIIDNEAMGNSATVISTSYDYDDDGTELSVAANTGLDMMYHAVRVWYVNDKTAIYVVDLAKVETLTCGEMTGSAKLEKGKTIAHRDEIGEVGEAYEYYLIDNSALNADYAAVVLNAKLATLGVRSEVNKSTVIDGDAVKNDYIKTDISEISKRDSIIYVKASDKAYHVYAVGATTGSVESITSTGVITLTDDTVIAPSALATNVTAMRDIVREALAEQGHTAPVFSFVLDTHGHYIALTNDPHRTVAYYTGAVKLSSAHDAWSSDVTWLAQFVDVATGDIEEIPVTNDWAIFHGTMGAIFDQGKYFDITDELYGDATYEPEDVPVNSLYGTSYILSAPGVSSEFTSTSSLVNCNFTDTATGTVYQGGNIRYNNASVNFIIASFQGDRLVVDEYTGVAELLAAYTEKYNDGIHTVTLENIAMVVERSDAGNFYATTIFAYDGALNVEGGILFFPTGVTASQWTAHTGYYSYPYAYLNGKASEDTIKVNPELATNYERGFYTYTVDDATGYYNIVKADTDYIWSQSEIEGAGDAYWIGNTPVSTDVKVVDLRAGALNGDVDAVDSLGDLLSHDYTDAWEKDLRVAYYVSGGQVVLVYVIDNIYGSVEVVVDESLDDWAIVDPAVVDGTGVAIEDEIQLITRYKVYNDAPEATLLYTGDAHLANGGSLDVAYSYVEDGKTYTGVINGAEAKIVSNDDYSVQKLVVDFTGLIPDNADGRIITITDITARLNITNKTGIEGSSLREANGYKDLKAGAEDDTYTLNMTITEAAGGYKVVLEGADIVKDTKVNVKGFEAEVPTNNAVRITISAGEPVANIDAVIGKVTLDTTITVHHDILAYWEFAGEDHVTIENAVLGDSIKVTLDRVDFSSFHSGDSVTFANVYGDSVTSSAMENNQVTLKVTPNSNDALLQGGTDVCPHNP